MTTCPGQSCLFGLPRMPFVNCCQFMYLVITNNLGFEDRILDLIVSVPDHCYCFTLLSLLKDILVIFWRGSWSAIKVKIELRFFARFLAI